MMALNRSRNLFHVIYNDKHNNHSGLNQRPKRTSCAPLPQGETTQPYVVCQINLAENWPDSFGRDYVHFIRGHVL